MRSSRAAIAFAAVTCALAPAGYTAMFSSFREYDDEGYFLITLRDYLSGHALYAQVPTIYGPFFYESMGALFKLLGVEPGHDSGRFVTLAVWLIASLVGGLAAYRLTRNMWLGLGAQFVTFNVLVPLIDEPMHPSGLVSLLLMGLALAAAFRRERPRAAALFLGAIVAALCLVKINVGAFAAIAVAFAFAGSLTRYRRPLLPLMAIVVVALPPVLMSGMLSRDWVLEYAAVVALSGAALGVACLVALPKRLPPPSGGWLAAGGVVIAIASMGAALATGTRLVDLLNGPLVGAARLPQVFVVPLNLGAVYILWAVASLVVMLVILSRRELPGLPASFVGLLRIAVGFLMWMALLRLPSSVFLLTLPLAWVATRPPPDQVDGPTIAYARVLLPALAVLESLQAYPVAGTQLSLAALALMPVGAVIISDGIRQLRQAGLEALPPRRMQGIWVGPATALVSIAAFLYLGFYSTAGFMSVMPLGLPGAESVRVPAQQGTAIHSVVAALDRDCSSFITFPGLNSFYFWTRQVSPVQLYSGAARGLEKEVWMYELDSGTQQAVVQELSNQPRLCVVKDQAVIDFWARGRQAPTGPLLDFIAKGFVDSGRYGDYELLVRR